MLLETGRLPSGLAVRPGVPWNDYSLQQFLLNVKAEKPPSDLKGKMSNLALKISKNNINGQKLNYRQSKCSDLEGLRPLFSQKSRRNFRLLVLKKM